MQRRRHTNLAHGSPLHRCFTRVLLACFALGILVGSASGQILGELRKQTFPDGVAVASIAPVDFDGDGDLDLLQVQNGTLDVLRNDGEGQFEVLPTGQATPGRPVFASVVGDVDGDGDADAIAWFGLRVLTAVGPTMLIRNNAPGLPTLETLPQAPDQVTSLLLADTDGDGDEDLIVSRNGSNAVLLNDGTGQFVDASGVLPPNNDMTSEIAAADVDGDQDLDLVVANGLVVELLLNNGRGAFTASATPLPPQNGGAAHVRVGDMDGDGDVDIVFANSRLRLNVNDGTGRFTIARAPATQTISWSLSLQDYDGDGDLDVLRPAVLGEHAHYANDGSGGMTLEPTRLFPWQISWHAAGDLDGDGDLDVIGEVYQAAPGPSTALLRNDGTGRFVSNDVLDLPPRDVDVDIQFGDLNGDGLPDLLACSLGSTTASLNDGTGRFVEQRDAVGTGGFPEVVASGDLDGDGDVDLVTARVGLPTNAGMPREILLNDGSTRFTVAPGSPFGGSRSTSAILVFDADQDGDLDIVFGNASNTANPSGQNEIYLGDGAGGFQDGTSMRLPNRHTQTTCGAAGDIDGDGDVDLVFGRRVSATEVLLNDGTGRFIDAPTATTQTLPANMTAVELADLDGDGNLDLVSAVGDTQVAVTWGAGNGAFANTISLAVPSLVNRRRVAVGDFDRDGDLDLAVAGIQSRHMFENRGRTDFAERQDWTDASSPADTVGVADIDQDGDPDVVWGSRFGAAIERNLTAQTHVRDVPAVGQTVRTEVYARGATNDLLVFLAVGTTPASIRIPGIGTLRLDPNDLRILTMPLVPAASGTIGYSFGIPNDPSLAGRTLMAQSLILETVTRKWRLTNATADVILN